MRSALPLGTFHGEGELDSLPWEATVEYILEAQVIDANELMVIILTNYLKISSVFNSLPTSGDFCHLLITFANSLDPDQARQNVGPDLDSNCLTP